MTSIDPVSDDLDGDGRGFATADAERGNAAFLAALDQRMQQRRHDACAGRANRMAKCTGAAIHVDALMRDADVLHRGHRHNGKGE